MANANRRRGRCYDRQKSDVCLQTDQPALEKVLRVTHDERTRGLCNAVTLNKQDRGLGKLKWRENINCRKLGLASARPQTIDQGVALTSVRASGKYTRFDDDFAWKDNGGVAVSGL